MPAPPPSPSKRKSIINGVVGAITGNNKGQNRTQNENLEPVKRNSNNSTSSDSSNSSSPSTLFSESEDKTDKDIENIEDEKSVQKNKESLEKSTLTATPKELSESPESPTKRPKQNQILTDSSSILKTTVASNKPTVRLVSGSSIQSPILIDEETSNKQMYSKAQNLNDALNGMEIPPGDYGRMPSSRGNTQPSPTRSKSNNNNNSSSTRIIRSNAQKNLNWSTSSLVLPNQQQHSEIRSISSVFDNKAPNLAAAAAIASLEEEKARKLRDEIAQGSVELQQLQSILAQLPRMKRTSTRATPDSSIFSSSISSSINSHSSTSIPNSSGHNASSPGFTRSHSILGTSQVITDLQSTIDVLKCQLSEQEQIAKEEHDSKEALKKRCEIVESTLDSLRHQNGNLTQLLARRERRISELEHDIQCKAREISLLRQSETNSLSAQVDYQQRILHLQEERDRLEAGYNTVIESSKRMKNKYQDDLSDVTSKVMVLQQQRTGDVAKITSLEVRLRDQSIDHGRLLELQSEMSQLRQQHVGTIDKLFLDMKRTMSLSDHSITTKVDSIQAVIDLVDKSATGSKISTSTTTTTSSSDEVIEVNIS